MKQIRKIAMLMVMLLVVTCVALQSPRASAAVGETSGTRLNISWSLDEATHTLTVSGQGDMDFNSRADVPWEHLKDRDIRKAVVEPGITSIGQYAFDGCLVMKEVKLADTVVSVAYRGFADCPVLETVDLGQGMQTFASHVFVGNVALRTLTFPETMLYTGDAAFAESGLQTVKLPEGMLSIGNDAFAGCTRLKSVSLPSTMAAIPDRAFLNCSVLQTVALREGLETIGERAFLGCPLLTNSVYGDTVLGSFRIPNSVTTIGSEAFGGCALLKDVTFGTGLQTLGNNAFVNCTGLKKAILPDGLLVLGASVFHNNDALVEIRIPNTLQQIQNNVFEGCDALRYVAIPEGLESLSNGMFYHCTGLESVSLPKGMVTINSNLFAGCTSLKAVSIPDSVVKVEESAFDGCTGLASVKFSENLSTIERRAFQKCNALRNVTLPDSLTNMGSYVFADCEGMLSLSIPGSLSEVSSNAFKGCSSLQQVSLGNGVLVLKNRCFYGCNSVAELVIPASVIDIEVSALGQIPAVKFEGAYPRIDRGAFDAFYTDPTIAYYPSWDPSWDNLDPTAFPKDRVTWTAMEPSLVFPQKEARVKVGQKLPFAAKHLPESTEKITYSVGNTKIARVDAAGNITGVAPGNTWLYAKSGSKTTKCLIRVQSVPVTGVKIPFTEKVTHPGESFTFKASVIPADATYKTIKYSVGNEAIARVDAGGKVTGVSVGNTWLYAKSNNGKVSKCLVKVLPTTVTSLTSPESTHLMPVGGSYTFKPIVKPAAAANQPMKFRVGNTSIAQVDSKGVVRGLRVGNTWLYATSGNGKQCKVLLQVLPKATGISVPSEKRVSIGGTVNVGAKLTPSNACPEKLTYTVGNTRIATVDAKGNVRGVSTGNTWLTVRSAGGKTAKCLIRVSGSSVPVTGITYPYTEKVVQVGGTARFCPTVQPANATNKTLKYSVGNTKIATVDANGNIRGVSAGNTWLYATAHNGKQIKILLRVQGGSIQLPAERTVYVGDMVTIKPVCSGNPKFTFRIGNAQIATVDMYGHVIGISTGNTWLHVSTPDGRTAKCLIKVVR